MKITNVFKTFLLILSVFAFLFLDYITTVILVGIFCFIFKISLAFEAIYTIWWIILIIRAVLYSEAKRRAQK